MYCLPLWKGDGFAAMFQYDQHQVLRAFANYQSLFKAVAAHSKYLLSNRQNPTWLNIALIRMLDPIDAMGLFVWWAFGA